MTVKRKVTNTFPITVYGKHNMINLSAEFLYREVEPFEVTMKLATSVWTVSRELLKAGLDAPAGEGEIHLWPAADILMMHLTAPTGEALVELPFAEVRKFLRRTEKLVPIGSEEFVIDEELTALLREDGCRE